MYTFFYFILYNMFNVYIFYHVLYSTSCSHNPSFGLNSIGGLPTKMKFYRVVYCMPRDSQNPLAYGYVDPNGIGFTCLVRGIGGVVRVFPHT